jgi:hypothetical protein
VSISDPAGALGKFRYLLFDVSETENEDDFGNTFFSEIDVVSTAQADAAASKVQAPSSQPIRIEGRFVTIDVTEAPDLEDWSRTQLLPVCDEWYPKIVDMLPSDGYTAPKHCTIAFKGNMSRGIPAMTNSNRVTCNTQWFRRNLNGEARGAVVHELVHVVQQYGAARRNNPNATANPGWMVEGIADYIRWFLYEPQTKGALVRDPSKAKFDASYRVTANFLNWVTEKYDRDLVREMNAAMRAGNYSADLWKKYTGKEAQELGEEWKADLPANVN